jgi:hypothetical protein
VSGLRDQHGEVSGRLEAGRPAGGDVRREQVAHPAGIAQTEREQHHAELTRRVRRVGGDLRGIDREARVLDRVVPAFAREAPDVAEPTGRDRAGEYRLSAEVEGLGHLDGPRGLQHATNPGLLESTCPASGTLLAVLGT